MNKLFVRLYFFVVITILVAGIALDTTWRYFETTKMNNSDQQSLLNALTLHLKHKQVTSTELKTLGKNIGRSLKVILPKDQSYSSIQQELTQHTFLFMQSEGYLIGFKRIPGQKAILAITFEQTAQNKPLKSIFILVFYGLIAMAIYLWIRPLSNDLNKLEQMFLQFDSHLWKNKIELPATSPILHLAQAYNRLLDKIKELLGTQKSLSHSISHELRTPLARIKFALQMAKEAGDESIFKQQLKNIEDDVSEMNSLLNELLGFAALENNSSRANLEKGNIQSLLSEIVKKLSANHQNVEIIYRQTKENAMVSCDSYLMERAVQNLIVNACKFCRSKVIISFQTKNGTNQILVEDDGKGVPEDHRQKIFTSFVQLNNESRQNQSNKGFGLGLAIVKRIMDIHHGRVDVNGSNLGGARFVLSWPCESTLNNKPINSGE